MSDICAYDNKPATEEWSDGTPMCEDCYSESRADLTCDRCGDVTGEVKMGNVNAYMVCRICGDMWM